MNNIVAITMPRWGLTMDEGLLAGWLVEVGSAVSKGAEILDVESTKLAGGVEAPADGVLRRQIVDAGQTVPCGTLLGIIADGSVSDAELDAFADSFVVVEVEDEEQTAGPETIDVSGRRISYLRKGSGAPTLLIHGFGGNAAGWAFVQDALSADFDTIAFDLPGHGESTKSVEDGSLGALAALVADLIEALGTRPVNIIAHSMGGGVAIALAASRPDLVKAMVLLAPMGLGQAINTDYLKDFIASEKHRDIGNVLRTLFADPNLVNRQLIDEVQRYKRIDGVHAALDTISFAIAQGGVQVADLRDAIAALPQPIAILWGADDSIIPPDQAPADIATILPGVGHMPQAEAPQKVIEAARTIFRR